MIDHFIKIVQKLSLISGILAAVLLGSAVMVVCQMVALRYFFGAPALWQTDYITFSIVATTLLGSPYVQLLRGHVGIELITHYLSTNARKILYVGVSTFALIFTATLCWLGTELFYEAWREDWRTESVAAMPLWIGYLCFPAGIGLLSLQILADILASLKTPAAD